MECSLCEEYHCSTFKHDLQERDGTCIGQTLTLVAKLAESAVNQAQIEHVQSSLTSKLSYSKTIQLKLGELES